MPSSDYKWKWTWGLKFCKLLHLLQGLQLQRIVWVGRLKIKLICINRNHNFFPTVTGPWKRKIVIVSGSGPVNYTLLTSWYHRWVELSWSISPFQLNCKLGPYINLRCKRNFRKKLTIVIPKWFNYLTLRSCSFHYYC